MQYLRKKDENLTKLKLQKFVSSRRLSAVGEYDEYEWKLLTTEEVVLLQWLQL